MIEVWVDIEGIPFYQVSNKGNFRSITREVTVTSTRKRPYKKIINGTSLKPFKCKSTGYLQIKVYGKKYSAHRIVAKAFCTGFCDSLVVNHKNGQRDDNRAENLEWVSHSENSKHGYKQNGRIPISLGKFSGDHPASKAVISTDMKTGEEVYYEAAMDAVREGFDSSSISRCCNGESSYHKGRFWRFANETMKARWGDRAA